jgi:bifunctional ADP-heptose synthase (sugar kinase/adenylyltransferase)
MKKLSPLAFQQLREEFRIEGSKVAHCHGVFDLLYPGHIACLDEAKSIADAYCVNYGCTLCE